MQSVGLDQRIVKVSIEVNGQLKTYTDLAIWASGTKYANANQNECEVRLANLDKATRDFVVTETSPFNRNRTPKRIIVEAGRVSYGTSRVYVGNIISAVNSQPPDIVTTLKCLTGNFLKGNIISRMSAPIVSLKQLSQEISQDLDYGLNFQATDKSIGNYTFSGAALKQIERLGEMGAIDAFVDDETLIVKDLFTPLSGNLRIVNVDSGMIGTPEFTEQGIKVTYFLDGQTKLGGALRVQSRINPAVNGDYVIYKLGFSIANRDTPFYWIAEGRRRR